MDDRHNSKTPNTGISSPDNRYRLKSASVILTKLEPGVEFSPKRPSVCWAEHSEVKGITRRSTPKKGDDDKTANYKQQGSPSQFTHIKTRSDGNIQDNAKTNDEVHPEVLQTVKNKKDFTNFTPVKTQEMGYPGSSLFVEDAKEDNIHTWTRQRNRNSADDDTVGGAKNININSRDDTVGSTNKDVKLLPSYSIIKNKTNATIKRHHRLKQKGVVHTVTIEPDFDNSSKNVVIRTQNIPVIHGGENKTTTEKNVGTKQQQVISPKRDESIVIMPFAEKKVDKRTTTTTKGQKSNDKLEKISEMLREKSSYVWPRALIKEERKTPQKTKRQSDSYPNRSSKRKCSSLVKNESGIVNTENITGTKIDKEVKVKVETEEGKPNINLTEVKNNTTTSTSLSNEKKESVHKVGTKSKLKTELVVKSDHTTGNNKMNSLWTGKTFSGCMLVSACAATVKPDEKRQQRTIPAILSRSKSSKPSPANSKVNTDSPKSKEPKDKVRQIENNETRQSGVNKGKERTGRKQTYTNIKPWMFPSLQNRPSFCRPFPSDLPTWSQFSMLFQESNGYSLETQQSLYTYYNDMCRNYYKNINAMYSQYNARGVGPAGGVGSYRETNPPTVNTSNPSSSSYNRETLHTTNTKFPNVNMFPLAAMQQQINKVGGYITPNARWVPYHNQRADKNTFVTYAGKHFPTSSHTTNTPSLDKASTQESHLAGNPTNMKTQNGGNHKFILPRSGGSSQASMTGKYTQAASNMAVKETSVVLDKLRIGKPLKASTPKRSSQKDNKFLEVSGGSMTLSSVKRRSDVTTDNSGKTDAPTHNGNGGKTETPKYNCNSSKTDAFHCDDNSIIDASQCNDNCTSNPEDGNTLGLVYAFKEKPCDEFKTKPMKNNIVQSAKSNIDQDIKTNAAQAVKTNIDQAQKTNIDQDQKGDIDQTAKAPGIDLSKSDKMVKQGKDKWLVVDQKKPNIAETTQDGSQQSRFKSDIHQFGTDTEGDILHLYDHAYTKTPDSSPCKAGTSQIRNHDDHTSVCGDQINQQVPVYAVTYGNKLLLLSANKIDSNKMSPNACQSDSVLQPTSKLASPGKRQVKVSTTRKKRVTKHTYKKPAFKGISRKRVNFAKHLYLGRSSRKSETEVDMQEKKISTPRYMCAVCICIDKNDLNSLSYTVSTLSITVTGNVTDSSQKENSFYKARLTYDLEFGDLKHLETECLKTGFYHIAEKCSVGGDVNRSVEAATLVPYPADIDDLPEDSSWIAIGEMHTIFDSVLPKVPSGDLQSLLKSVLPKDSFLSGSMYFINEKYRPKRDARIWYDKHFDYFTKKYCRSKRVNSGSINKEKIFSV